MPPLQPKLSVIMPAFNEERRIGDSLDKITGFLSFKPYGSEIIVVDDGSSDSTASLVENRIAALGAQGGASGGVCRSDQDAMGGSVSRGVINVRLIRLRENSGKGRAVREGMMAAEGELCLMTDSDLSTPIEELDRFIQVIESGWDLAIGSRAIEGSLIEVHQAWYRENLGKAFNFAMRLITGLPFKDTQCGFKLFRGKVAKELFGPLVTARFAFDVEIIKRAVHAGFKVKEVPVVWRNSPSTKVRAGRDGLKMLFDTFKIARRLG